MSLEIAGAQAPAVQLLTQAHRAVRSGCKSNAGYERAMFVLKDLRTQLESIPGDIARASETGEATDHDDTPSINARAPPVSFTKGRKRLPNEPKIVGAPGEKKCTRYCGNCGLKAGHNAATCPHPPKHAASSGRGRGRCRGRGRIPYERDICRRLWSDDVEDDLDDSILSIDDEDV